MMIFLKIEEADGGLAVVLTEEARRLLKVGPGDALCLVETPEGKVEIQARGSTHEERLARGLAFVEDYRPTFEALAK